MNSERRDEIANVVQWSTAGLSVSEAHLLGIVQELWDLVLIRQVDEQAATILNRRELEEARRQRDAALARVTELEAEVFVVAVARPLGGTCG